MPELKYLTTEKDSGFPEYLDFATLRKLGIQHLAELSGKIWTDHNLHDPGITMLEALCYVLTDLDYRTKLDFKDLIAAPQGSKEDNFYTAAQILGNNPLTISDIRRMLIDIKGVRNAWVEPQEFTLAYDCENRQLLNTPLTRDLTPVPLGGLYKVLIEPDDVYAAAYEKDACGNDVFPLESMLASVDERLHAHRNLCEDFEDIQVLEKEPISFCIHIELAANFDPDDVLVNIYSAIQDFFSPAPVFYTLQQLLEKERSIEEIFEGRPFDFAKNEPLQQNGFIDAAELENLQRIKEIHASDLYRIIMNVPGVAGITRLIMTSTDEDAYPVTDANGNVIEPEGEEWKLTLKENHRPVLSPATSNVIFFRNKIQFTANRELAQQRYIKSIAEYNKYNKKPGELDTIVPEGRQLDLAQYTSVQYEFPKLYMIGKNDVPGDDTAARKAQALQLQGYLLFYDRLLADYFAQLANIRHLYSFNPQNTPQTYFRADISAIPQLPSLLRYEKKLPGTAYSGQRLAFEPGEDGVTPKEYSSMYLRDEMIRRIISETSSNTVTRSVIQLEESGKYILQIIDKTGSVLLEGATFFDTETEAEQAALDIVFLATLPESYSRNNNRKEEKFSFELVYNDAGSTEMLAALYETSAQYQERKERFQNHLLARFSEDFTDYALMMYNLSGKKNDPESSIEDKSAFLTSYAETSANRAQAFDYKHPAAGFPVYGLQKRVGGLMGIRRSPSVSLNNFDLVKSVKLAGFTCNIPHQPTSLFSSDSLHDPSRINDVFDQFLLLGKNRKNYKPYGCPGEGVFGFHIQGKVVLPFLPGVETRLSTEEEYISAGYSVEYNTVEERDLVIDWFVHFFENDGQYKIYPQTQEGYYFLLPDDYGKILLKSKHGYPTPEEALQQGYDCLEVLQDDNNWDIIPDITEFRIVVKQLAYHPLTFGTEENALLKMQELQKYFKKHFLTYQKELAELYNWQSGDAWQGIYPFKTTAQLPAAFIQFVELASKPENYRVIDQYNLQVVRVEEEGETVMAKHLFTYETREAAEAAISSYVSQFSEIWTNTTGAVATVSAATYSFKDHKRLLLNSGLIPEGASEARYVRNIVRHAADPASVSLLPSVGCRYSVIVKNEQGQVLAQSPEAEDHEAAVKLMERILLKAGQDELLYQKTETVEAYSFEDSHIVFDTAIAAATAYLLTQPDAWKVITLNHYFFRISDEIGLLLQEPNYYTSYEAVRTAFYTTVKFGKQRQYYQLTIDCNCTYGFKIIDDAKTVLAVHPFQYTTVAERDNAVDRTLRYLQEHGQVVNEVKLVGAWKYQWQWLSCCCWLPEIAFEGLDEKPEKDEAEKALEHIIKDLATDINNYKIFQEENGYHVYLIEGDLKVAVHPHGYDHEHQAMEAIERLINWAIFVLRSSNNPFETDQRTDLYQKGDGNVTIGYRLWDRDFRIARYITQFDSPDKRNAAVEELVKRYQRKLPVYTFIEQGSSAVANINGQYYFQIRRDDLLLWQSINAYGDADAAMQAFRDQCWQILLLSTDRKNYLHTTEGLFLNDAKGLPVAVYTGTYDNETIIVRQQFALKHGVYLTKNKTYAFHIYNAKTRMYDWQSTHTYSTADDAANALLEFIQLLLFRGNYSPDNETVGCYYSINIAKVLLDIQRVTERCEGEAEEVSEDDAWSRLQAFLDKQEPDTDNFFPYTDYPAGCRYSFRMVDSDVYRVAQHTGWYQSMEKREEVRLELLADIFCKRRLYGWFVAPDADNNKDPKILENYFPDPSVVNYAGLWMSYKRIASFDNLWVPATETLPGVTRPLHYYQLKDIDGNVIWNTVTRYSTAALAEKEQYFFVYLLEMARSAASYYYEPQVGCENAFTLYLKDMDGKVIAVAPGVVCKEDIARDQATRIFNAMMFPIVENGKGYSFEINNVLPDDYETIWESIQLYDTPEEARTALNKACDLLLLLPHYQRGDETSCGPYGITLVNPDGILAEHPLSYTGISARNAAIEEVQAAISSEGFHMLEHILLRPRTRQQSYEAWQLLWNDVKIISETVFEDAAAYLNALRNATGVYRDGAFLSWYNGNEKIAKAETPQEVDLSNVSTENITLITIPVNCSEDDVTLPACSDVCLCCDQPTDIDEENKDYCDLTYLADPYSFWATVVLPAWPQRFRLARFRQFFEDTLRREAPAHIRLNIVWISPQQMLQFEKAWMQWLAALARDGSCDYNSSLQELNTLLMDLKNVYPAAYLYDDEGGDDKPLIILDEAMLG